MKLPLIDRLATVKNSPAQATPVRARGALRKDAALNRDRLLAAATEVFARDGLSATIDDIALHAGVGVGTAYRNFANKQVLIETLLNEQVATVFQVAEEAAAQAEDPWSAFEMFLWHSLRLQAENRGLREMVVLNRSSGNQQARERLAPVTEKLMRAAQASGQMRPEISTNDVPAVFWMISGLLDQTVEVSPTLWQRYLRLILDGMRVPATQVTPLSPAALSETQLDALLEMSRSKA